MRYTATPRIPTIATSLAEAHLAAKALCWHFAGLPWALELTWEDLFAYPLLSAAFTR